MNLCPLYKELNWKTFRLSLSPIALSTKLQKHRVELPTTPSYHYTPGSAINISLADASTSNTTSIFGRFQFQNKQQKEDLLGPYGIAATPWELSEEEKEGSEDQGFTYQNLISENSEFGIPNVQTPRNPNIKNLEIETLNIRTQQNQNNQNSDLINQSNVLPNIVINHPPIDLIVKPIQQPPQQPNLQIQQPQRPS
ncbi:hypothetical protein G9A89_011430 [Geosiphon pyriformis]|nr:hypothetical protein G9A89_011430 [Geosiphon pyriformis]